MKTAADFQQQAKKLQLRSWPFHKCSICNCSIRFLFNEQGQVGFDGGCDCSDTGAIQLRSWEDIADHYNMQDHPDEIAKMNAFWKWETT